MCRVVIYRWICLAVLLGDSMAASMSYDGHSSQLLPNTDDNTAIVANPVFKTKGNWMNQINRSYQRWLAKASNMLPVDLTKFD